MQICGLNKQTRAELYSQLKSATTASTLALATFITIIWTASGLYLQMQSWNLPSLYSALGADFLYVYDGGSSSSPLIGKFSGTTLPSPITSSSNKLLVRFTSDSSETARGFRASYRGRLHLTRLIGQILCLNNPLFRIEEQLISLITNDYVAGGEEMLMQSLPVSTPSKVQFLSSDLITSYEVDTSCALSSKKKYRRTLRTKYMYITRKYPLSTPIWDVMWQR